MAGPCFGPKTWAIVCCCYSRQPPMRSSGSSREAYSRRLHGNCHCPPPPHNNRLQSFSAVGLRGCPLFASSSTSSHSVSSACSQSVAAVNAAERLVHPRGLWPDLGEPLPNWAQHPIGRGEEPAPCADWSWACSCAFSKQLIVSLFVSASGCQHPK